MARATAHAFARDGYALVLAGRDGEELDCLAADCAVRFGVAAHPLMFDAEDMASCSGLFDASTKLARGAPTVVVWFAGYMAAQVEAQEDFEIARRMVDVNLTAAIAVLEPVAAWFEANPHGHGEVRRIGIVSSVAGERGRQSNYLYGATKAGLSAYAQGLRNRLYKADVAVTTLLPGFVDTAMTYGLPLPGALTASPAVAGTVIHDVVVRGREVAYVPFFWRFIMLIIKSVPEPIFKRLSL